MSSEEKEIENDFYEQAEKVAQYFNRKILDKSITGLIDKNMAEKYVECLRRYLELKK